MCACYLPLAISIPPCYLAIRQVKNHYYITSAVFVSIGFYTYFLSVRGAGGTLTFVPLPHFHRALLQTLAETYKPRTLQLFPYILIPNIQVSSREDASRRAAALKATSKAKRLPILNPRAPNL